MIIQCTSCSRKFLVKDQDIPAEGRTVQCGFCSVTWHQKPIINNPTTNIKKTISPSFIDNEDAVSQVFPVVKASDGNTYKFLGSQWAKMLPDGTTGLFAKKIIGAELNKRIGREKKKVTKKRKKKIKEVNPSSAGLLPNKQLPKIARTR